MSATPKTDTAFKNASCNVADSFYRFAQEQEKRIEALKLALVQAYPLLRRVRDHTDAVQFFEANAAMVAAEDALRPLGSLSSEGDQK